jgi:membrane-associated phospholipid phosphatase
MSWLRWRHGLLRVAMAGSPLVAGAQPADSVVTPAWHPTGRDLAMAGGATAVALGLLPVDARLARSIDRRVADSPRLSSWAQYSGVFGDPGAAVIAGTLLVGGRLSGQRGIAATGLHGIEALAVSSAITTSLKKLVGRARPNAVTDYTAFTFSPLQPKPGYASLPSGHATAAFTLAAVVHQEVAHAERFRSHPAWRRALTGVAYGLATATAGSRLVERKHWASDVVLGAGIGVVSGHWLTRWRRQAPRTRVERWLIGG